MDEKTYRNLVDATLAHIDAAFADVDPDLAESNIAQGALTILFPGGIRAIVSPQPPVRQMWLGVQDRRYHFQPDGARWRHDKGDGLQLYARTPDMNPWTTGGAG